MQFDFGENWVAFSTFALTPERIERAGKDFTRLFEGIPIQGKSFLDIGFGQGLSLLFAQRAGAHVCGTDINPKCREALEITASVLKTDIDVPIVIGSILDGHIVESLRALAPSQKGFDIVHSWGVLHHTGHMKTALHNAASLIADNGYLILAIYNRHVTSGAWLLIKWIYCKSPRFVRSIITAVFVPIIALAKLAVTGKNPFRQNRGMDFYYNVIDWIGGYPYEYASKDEVIAFLAQIGFSCSKFIPAEVPTGCNEFVFKKEKNDAGQ